MARSSNEAAAQVVTDAAANVNSAGSSSHDAAVPPQPLEAEQPGGDNGAEVDDDIALAGASVLPHDRVRNRWIPSFGGCQVAFRDYVGPSGKSYRNFKLMCPHHTDCIKTKGEVASLGSLGPVGPLAFRHAWALIDSSLDAVKTHVQLNPSKVHIREMADLHAADFRNTLDACTT